MKVYIAGPITGIPDRNRHAFESMAIYLRRMGYEVVSPLEVNPPGSCRSWNEAMRRDIPHLVSRTSSPATPSTFFPAGRSPGARRSSSGWPLTWASRS